jgi:hypothetical protein
MTGASINEPSCFPFLNALGRFTLAGFSLAAPACLRFTRGR